MCVNRSSPPAAQWILGPGQTQAGCRMLAQRLQPVFEGDGQALSPISEACPSPLFSNPLWLAQRAGGIGSIRTVAGVKPLASGKAAPSTDCVRLHIFADKRPSQSTTEDGITSRRARSCQTPASCRSESGQRPLPSTAVRVGLPRGKAPKLPTHRRAVGAAEPTTPRSSAPHEPGGFVRMARRS